MTLIVNVEDIKTERVNDFEAPKVFYLGLDRRLFRRWVDPSGNRFMAHRTGFTVSRLGRLAMEAGFTQAHVGRRLHYDLWAVLSKSQTDPVRLNDVLKHSSAAFLFEAGSSASA